jgi:predicted transcriptional regulator
MSYDAALVAEVRALLDRGMDKQAIADQLGLTRSKVRRILAATRNEALEALGVRKDRQSKDAREIEAVAVGRVETIEQAVAAAGVDLSAWEVVGLETRHYPVQTKDGLQQGTYIKLRCAPKDGPDLRAQVDALVAGALDGRTLPPQPAKPLGGADGALGLVVITDPHFGKLAWAGSTGEQGWDLRIAQRTVDASVAWLLDRLPPVERVVLALLGDVFHYDTLSGTTTGGTMMDRDSRVAKVLAVGSETVTRAVWRCAAKAPTDVIAVPGNHDSVLTLALQRILMAEFRTHAGVTVDDTFTRRKPYVWGRTLLQFDHGDKAKKKLAYLLPQEHPALWGQSTYREIHTGHLHTDMELLSTLTEQGVVVRTHPALCPSDQWHFDEGYTGSVRGAQAFVYRVEGGLEQTLRFDPRLHLEAA